MEKENSLGEFIDIHICGACKTQFNNVDVFLLHKSQCPSLAELRAKMASKMMTVPAAEPQSQMNTAEDIRPSEGEITTLRNMEHPEDQTNEQQIQEGTESQTINIMPSSLQPVVLTKSTLLQADGSQTWTQAIDQNPQGSGVMYLSSDESVVFQRSKEENLLQKESEARNEDLSESSQTIYVETIPHQLPDQSQMKEERYTLEINEGNSGKEGERTVIVTENLLVPSSGGMVIESNTLMPNAEIVQQEHYLTSGEGADNSVEGQVEVYGGDANSRSMKGHELMMAIDDPISPSRKKYKCTFAACNFVTLYIRDLERHVRTHTGEKPFQCPHCSKAFSRSDKLKIHLRGHTGSKPFKCHICEYGAADSSSLRKHLRIHTDERPFKCQICPYASRNSSQLIVHLRTHTGDTPFQCSRCDAKFKINSDLKRHMRTHTGEKPYGCDLCDYRCSIRGNLKSHLRINHSNENEVKCNYCDYQTSSKKMLREHKKLHDSTHPIKCPTCNYCCASNSALKAHMRIHSEDRPFNCTFCSYSSKQSGNVKTHMRKKHPDKMFGDKKTGRPIIKKSGPRVVQSNSPSPTKIRDDRSFGSNLKPNCKKTFRCNICTAAFVREDSLRSHTRQHCKEIAQNLESTALAVLQLQNSGPSDSPTTEKVVSTIATMAQAGESIEQEMEGTMVVSPNTNVQSVNVLQSPLMSHTIDSSQDMVRRKRTSNRGLQDIAEAAATLSQIPHGNLSPVRSSSPQYHHQHYQRSAQSLGFSEESLSTLPLPPNSQHQALTHQQYVQPGHPAPPPLQNMYAQLKLVDRKSYLPNENLLQTLPPQHQTLHGLQPSQPPHSARVLTQGQDSGAINLQVVQQSEHYPVSLVTRDLQLQQQQQQQGQQHHQHQHHQQHHHQTLHQQHLLHQQNQHQPQILTHQQQAQQQQTQQQQQQQQQQQHHPAASSGSHQPQIQIILPSSGFASSHHNAQQPAGTSSPPTLKAPTFVNVSDVSSSNQSQRQRQKLMISCKGQQVSQPLPTQQTPGGSARPQIVVQFQEPSVSAPPTEPNVITLSSSMCQALISQIRMQDSIAGGNTTYQPDSTSVPAQEVVVAVDTQESNAHQGYAPAAIRPPPHS